MRKLYFSATVLVAIAVCGTSALAQGQSTALVEALSQIRSGLPSAGFKVIDFTNPDRGRQTDIRTFRPLVLDSCTIQIEMTQDTTVPWRERSYVSRTIYTIPLDKIDFKRIRVNWRDVKLITVILATIGRQKTISAVSVVTPKYKAGAKETNPHRFDHNLDSVFIDFEDKKAAQNMASAFSEASRLCSTPERQER